MAKRTKAKSVKVDEAKQAKPKRNYTPRRAVYYTPPKCPICGSTAIVKLDGHGTAQCVRCAAAGRATIFRLVAKA